MFEFEYLEEDRGKIVNALRLLLTEHRTDLHYQFFRLMPCERIKNYALFDAIRKGVGHATCEVQDDIYSAFSSLGFVDEQGDAVSSDEFLNQWDNEDEGAPRFCEIKNFFSPSFFRACERSDVSRALRLLRCELRHRIVSCRERGYPGLSFVNDHLYMRKKGNYVYGYLVEGGPKEHSNDYIFKVREFGRIFGGTFGALPSSENDPLFRGLCRFKRYCNRSNIRRVAVPISFLPNIKLAKIFYEEGFYAVVGDAVVSPEVYASSPEVLADCHRREKKQWLQDTGELSAFL